MLDVTTASATAAPPSDRPVGAVPLPVPQNVTGQRPPAGGTNLPSGSPAEAKKLPELPELERLAQSLSDFARSLNRDLSFSVHEASGRTVVTVLDGETREVIRQIPSEEFLRIAESLASSRALLVDREA